MKPFNRSTEAREWHPATNRAGCNQIEKALKRQGLDITFDEPLESGDDIFRVVCTFIGPDADPTANRWQTHNETEND